MRADQWMLTDEQYDALAEMVDAITNGEGQMRPRYTGRRSYGGECVAVDLPADSLTSFAFALRLGRVVGALETGEDFATLNGAVAVLRHPLAALADLLIDNIEHDAMGKGTVVYWPRIAVAE